jgi:hypothetical protein
METDAEMPMWAVEDFRQQYTNEIKQLLDSKQYALAYCIISSPAEEMRRNREQLTGKFHYMYGLATIAYELTKTLEKYLRNSPGVHEEDIKMGQSLLEMAINQSKLPTVQKAKNT